MTVQTLHPVASEYLDRLRKQAKCLSRARRRELLSEIEDHLARAISADGTEAQARTALDRLGEPEEIIAAEQPPEPDPRGTREWAAVFLLLLGFFVGALGWIVGVILLWSSRAWDTRDKLIGTFILPGGLVPVFAFLIIGFGYGESCTSTGNGQKHCTGGPGTIVGILEAALLILLLLAPIATSIYLARRARHHP